MEKYYRQIIEKLQKNTEKLQKITERFIISVFKVLKNSIIRFLVFIMICISVVCFFSCLFFLFFLVFLIRIVLILTKIK